MVSRNVRIFLQSIGRKGGKARARKSSPTARAAQARHAGVSRWMQVRFGTASFEALSLPGWEIVDQGLRDLASGNEMTLYALAVAELRPRMRFLGVPVPVLSKKVRNFRETLYRMMEVKHNDMTHERFCALLRRLDSFCDALATVAQPQQTPHRDRKWCA